MTVSTTTSRVTYAGNGSTVAFSVPFYFLANSDLVVYRTVGTSQTLLVLNTDYTVSGAGTLAGGSITCTTAPASGATLVIYRDPALTQLTDYQSNDPFPAETHERALDKLTMLAQRLKDLISRSFVLSDGDTSGASTTLPTPEANKLVGWNATATGLQNIDSSTLATLVAYGTSVADVFTGDGVTTAFTLTQNPVAIANLDVSVGGVVQLPTLGYTWSGGTTLTFTSAPPNGVKVLARYMQGLPTAYSAPISVTTSAGTAAMTLSDGTRSLTYTPNTTGVLNHVGALNISIGGSPALQFSTNRNVTIPAPASGIALALTGFGAQPVAYFAGAASNAGYVSIADGQTGTRVWSLIAGAGAAGVFGLYDATAAAYRMKVATTGESTFLGGVATTSVAVTFSATAMTVNCQLSNVFATTFTANVTTAPTVSNPQDGQTINWFITQDGTGNRTMTWPTSFKWAGGSAGVLSTAANSVDLLVATYRSATGFWYCSLQKAFA